MKRDLYSTPFVDGMKYFGLSIVVMISLLLGDYSIHSANIVALPKKKKSKDDPLQYGKIDWGAAFRDYLDPENSMDILFPKEYRGKLSVNARIKGFVSFYQRIPGFFEAVMKKAGNFEKVLKRKNEARKRSTFLPSILKQCLSGIPQPVIDGLTRDDLKYFGFKDDELNIFDSNRKHFFKRCFGPHFGALLQLRLIKLKRLTSCDTYKKYAVREQLSRLDRYQSVAVRPGSAGRFQVFGMFPDYSSDDSLPTETYASIVAQLNDELNGGEFKAWLHRPEQSHLLSYRNGVPIEKQLPIFIPQNKVSLLVGEKLSGSLSHFLQNDQVTNSKKARLLFIPFEVGDDKWVSILMYVDALDRLTSVGIIDSEESIFSEQATLAKVFDEIKLVYPQFNRPIHEYARNHTPGDLESTAHSFLDDFRGFVRRIYFGNDYSHLRHVAEGVYPKKSSFQFGCMPS